MSSQSRDEELGKIHVSWRRYRALVRRLLKKIEASGFKPKQIICVARGGSFPSDAASRFFGDIPIAFVVASSYPGAATRAEKIRIGDTLATLGPLVCEDILLVDDLTETGSTLAAIIEWLRDRYGIDPAQVRTAVVWHKRKSSAFEPHFYAEVVHEGPDGKMPWVLQPFDEFSRRRHKAVTRKAPERTHA